MIDEMAENSVLRGWYGGLPARDPDVFGDRVDGTVSASDGASATANRSVQIETACEIR